MSAVNDADITQLAKQLRGVLEAGGAERLVMTLPLEVQALKELCGRYGFDLVEKGAMRYLKNEVKHARVATGIYARTTPAAPAAPTKSAPKKQAPKGPQASKKPEPTEDDFKEFSVSSDSARDVCEEYNDARRACPKDGATAEQKARMARASTARREAFQRWFRSKSGAGADARGSAN